MKTPADRVCQHCPAILKWAGTAKRGQWRHSKPGGVLYITTHAPEPRPQYEPAD
jgi:hypothetical protein